MKTYNIYICPECDDQGQFAGFCSLCRTQPRLKRTVCVSVTEIFEHESIEDLLREFVVPPERDLR